MTAHHQNTTLPLKDRTQSLWWLWLGWVAFVVYGSLVPLEFKAIPLQEAVTRFQNMPYLTLSAESRADWIANGVLYVGVGLLSALLLTPAELGTIGRISARLGALAFGGALATSVEFAQVFFPQRTVSLNDLLAEYLGTTIGVVSAWLFGHHFQTLRTQLGTKLLRKSHLLLPSYFIVYFAYSLFPYDLVLSGREFHQKISTDQWGWFLAGPPSLKLVATALAEILLTVPLGLWWALRRQNLAPSATSAVAAGLGLGIAIEAMQLLLVSGLSQGLSILTRAAGMGMGSLLWANKQRWEPEQVQQVLRKAPIASFILYALTLSVLNGWWTGRWLGLEEGLKTWTSVRFIPFYYHYFTTEATALFSLAATALMYGVVGLLAWSTAKNERYAAVWAALAAGTMEAGKLFIANTHPDPTNLLIAPAAALLSHRLISWLTNFNSSHQPQASESRNQPSLFFPTLAALSAALWLWQYPFYPMVLGLSLGLYAWLAWRTPSLIFIAIPMAWPLLDLAPWTGRIFVDEFDALLLISVAIGYAKWPAYRVDPLGVGAYWRLGIMAALALSYGISTVVALTTMQWHDLGVDAHYFSPLNALRIAKGMVWALLLWPLVRRAQSVGAPVYIRFRTGMVSGLGGVLLFVLWERLAFAGLLDFNSQYRISGPLSAMHNGGAYIEAYLVVASAFLLHAISDTTRLIKKIIGFLLLGLTSYAIAVTYSRGGYAAYAAVLALMAFAPNRNTGNTPHRWKTIGLSTLALVAAMPAFLGHFATSRLALSTVEQDLSIRQSHWSGSLETANQTWANKLFGEGVGRFPTFQYWTESPEIRNGQHFVASSAANASHLVIGTGQPAFIDQLIKVEPFQQLTLRLRLRSEQTAGGITVTLCRKWMLTSYDCQIKHLVTQKSESWETLSAPLQTGILGSQSWITGGTIKLSLFNQGQSTVQVDDISLTTSGGQELLKNGDFEKGLDNWHFTSDHHLGWHVKSMPLGAYFDQGILGLLALSLILITAFWQYTKRITTNNSINMVGIACLTAFCITGAFDTLIDNPRQLMVVFLIYWVTTEISKGKPDDAKK